MKSFLGLNPKSVLKLISYLLFTQYTAMDDTSEYLAVAGRTGFAHYSVSTRKWRLFGNETQEKDFIVTGGILWWRENIIMGCYNLVRPAAYSTVIYPLACPCLLCQRVIES